MDTLEVEISFRTKYIFIDRTGDESKIDEALASIGCHSHYIVTNRSIAEAGWGSRYMDYFRRSSQPYRAYYVPEGEEAKSIDVALEIYRDLMDLNADRSWCIYALGGGTVGDLSGFIASTFKRGLRLVMIPTTLLSMIDSSIGGKNGVDYMGVKNVIGTFYFPEYVVIDLNFLETLPAREFISGLSEAIKYGVTLDRELFEFLERSDPGYIYRSNSALRYVVERSIAIKNSIVERDPLDSKGVRAVLNYGHTIGHAIELIKDLDLRHGEAVALGMLYECVVSREIDKSYCPTDVEKRLEDTLYRYGLVKNLDLGRYTDLVIHNLVHDKKIRKSNLKIPVVTGIGDHTIVDVPLTRYISLLKDFLGIKQ